jgi:hypothetical protein
MWPGGERFHTEGLQFCGFRGLCYLPQRARTMVRGAVG